MRAEETQHGDCSAKRPGVTRSDLIRWLWPYCDHEHAAVMYPQSGGSLSPGWVKGEEDVQRAAKAFVEDTLACERFESVTKGGKPYSIDGGSRLGFVPHRNSLVTVFCLDLDDHAGDGGNVHLRNTLARFFGASPVVFTSKGGKGYHGFFRLNVPMGTSDFVAWCKAWGFNRSGEPEVFPKTDKLSQVWLPGEPNEQGGDRYISGDLESCVINQLPKAPSDHLTSTTLRFLRGQQTQPGRNDALNKAAYELGQKQIDRAQAWNLCERGARLCGLDSDETRSTFDSGYMSGMQTQLQLSMKSPSQSNAGVLANQYELDGIGNGERFARMYGRDARYCETLDTWFVWDTTRWVQSKTRVQAMAKDTARQITDQKHRKKSSSKHGIREMLYLAGSEPGMDVELSRFDGNPMIFNCRSGTIDLLTGQIRKHDRTDLLSKISPVSYDQSGSCPRWLVFLETVFDRDQELISYIQRVCGYILTGDVSEQCLFFLYGDGCNGKSVFASMLQYVLGEYATRSPAELVMKSVRSSSGGASPDVARLMGARLAVTSELEEGHTLSESQVKDLSGGDRMVARPLYSSPFEFDPTHKLLLYGNHRPEVVGTDHGIWRRLRLIPFDVTIPESTRDRHLLDHLKGESGAILAWMVNGCLDWKRHGLGLPVAVHEATGGFRADSDAVGRFIEECCEHADGVFTLKSDMYKAYTGWCKRSGESALSGKALHPRMLQHGFTEKRFNSGRCWVGIELQKDQA